MNEEKLAQGWAFEKMQGLSGFWTAARDWKGGGLSQESSICKPWRFANAWRHSWNLQFSQNTER